MVTLRISMPLVNDDGRPVEVDDALGLWNAITQLAAECGWLSDGFECDFEGLSRPPLGD